MEDKDIFNERVQRAIIDSTSAIEMKRSVPNAVPSLLAVELHVTTTTSTVVTSPAEVLALPVTTAATSVPFTEASDIPVTSAAVTSTPITLYTGPSGGLLVSPTVSSAPPIVTVGSTTTPSTFMIKTPVTPVFSAPLLLSSGTRTTLTPSSMPLRELPSSSTTIVGHHSPTTATQGETAKTDTKGLMGTLLNGQPFGIHMNLQYITIFNYLTLTSLSTLAHYWKVQLQSQY